MLMLVTSRSDLKCLRRPKLFTLSSGSVGGIGKKYKLSVQRPYSLTPDVLLSL